jgi:hypothetical protein
MDKKELARQYVESKVKSIYHEDVLFGSEDVQDAFVDGMDTVIKEIEALFDREDWLESHRISIWRKLQNLKGTR